MGDELLECGNCKGRNFFVRDKRFPEITCTNCGETEQLGDG